MQKYSTRNDNGGLSEKKKNSLDLNHPRRPLAIMERDGDRFRPVRALLIQRSVLCMATDRLLLSMLDMLTKNRLRERVVS